MTHVRTVPGTPWRCGLDLAALVLLALAVRIVYLWLALSTQDITAVSMFAPDSHVYARLGEHYRTGESIPEAHLLVAGPGYPLLLAFLTSVFGPSPWSPTIVNVVLGSLAPVAVYLLAAALLQRRSVAFWSGLLVALSYTGISMSTSLLTDQPYYTLHAFGLLFFLWGLGTGRTRWFVAAGLVSVVATSIRPLGQLWPWVYLLLAAGWIALDPERRTWRLFAKSLWTPALLLTFTLAWSAHNASRHGIFTFTTNGVRASWAYLTATAVADHTQGGSFDSIRSAWSTQVLALVDGEWPPEATIHRRMKSQVLTVLREHPGWMLDSFRSVIWQNLRAPNFFAEAQLAQWRGYLVETRNVFHDWINIPLFFLTVLGWLLLLKAKLWRAALVLGVTYAFFTLITGFSFWQGSRLHFPAEMAYAILLAYLGVTIWPGRARAVYEREGVASA